jgi:hypothetical protein
MVSVKIALDKFSSSPFRIPLPYFYFGAFFGFGFDLRLPEDDFDRFRVVVRDELGVAQLVDERFATACEIVSVEEFGGVSRNAESNAILARFFSPCRAVQCWPSNRLRLGVR